MEINPGAPRSKAVRTARGLKSAVTGPGLSTAHLLKCTLTTSSWGINHPLKVWCRREKGMHVCGEQEGKWEPSARQPVQATHRGTNWTKTHLTWLPTMVFCGHWKHDSSLSSRGVTRPHHCVVSRWCPAVYKITTKKTVKMLKKVQMCHLLCWQ